MAIWIVLPILTLLMFDLGLSLKFEDFGKVFRSPWPIVVALLGQLVLLPLIALGLAAAFRLPPVFFIGLVLIACCPGGSSSNVFSKLAGGDVALSVTLTALSSVITLFTPFRKPENQMSFPDYKTYRAEKRGPVRFELLAVGAFFLLLSVVLLAAYSSAGGAQG